MFHKHWCSEHVVFMQRCSHDLCKTTQSEGHRKKLPKTASYENESLRQILAQGCHIPLSCLDIGNNRIDPPEKDQALVRKLVRTRICARAEFSVVIFHMHCMLNKMLILL